MTDQSHSAVTIETIDDFYSFHLDNTRPIEIYLPPDYSGDPQRKYKVLYANDGQDLRGLSLNSILDALYARHAIDPIIVVAIHATNDRMNEYGLSDQPDYRQRGSQATTYAHFVIDELMPFIDRHYRTLGGSMNTAIMGWSLGGLSAFDMAWQRPDKFGIVGAFSPSFWWRSDNSSPRSQQASRLAHRIVRAGIKRPGLRFWFQTGTRDESADRDRNGMIDSIQDTIELIAALKSIGYRSNREVKYVEVKDGRHTQETWAQALPLFLHWVFPQPPNRFVRWIDRVVNLARRNPRIGY
ncbi:MAG TPA: alpha/beta hydrolase-fold protein [Anaerolineae bacterium]|nr:alpha/beta hydrolase-fold protein [Anaerolineae bacterium]